MQRRHVAAANQPARPRTRHRRSGSRPVDTRGVVVSRTAGIRRGAPVRALSACASRTTSAVRSANLGTLMERRESRLWRTDGSPDYREARRRGDPKQLDAGGERTVRFGGSPASLSPGRKSLCSCEWAGLPRELSTVSHSGQGDPQRDLGAEREEWASRVTFRLWVTTE
jgi:hypothetical protein